MIETTPEYFTSFEFAFFTMSDTDSMFGATGGLNEGPMNLAGVSMSEMDRRNRLAEVDANYQRRQEAEKDMGEIMLSITNSHVQLKSDLERLSHETTVQLQSDMEQLSHSVTNRISHELQCRIDECLGRHTAEIARMTESVESRQQYFFNKQAQENADLKEVLVNSQRNFGISFHDNSGHILNKMASLEQKVDASLMNQGNPIPIQEHLQTFQAEVVQAISSSNNTVAKSLTSLAETVTHLAEGMQNFQVSLLGHVKNLQKQNSDAITKQQELLVAKQPNPQLVTNSAEYNILKPSSRNRQLFENDDGSVRPKHDSSSKKKYKQHKRDVSSSSESSDSDSASISDDSSKTRHRKGRKCSTFNGDRKFSVWYNQFKESVHGLDSEEKLSELKSLMRGDACDFVFDQLPSKTRKNYKLLKRELKHRFRKVENPKTFAAIFSKRNQKSSETVEEYSSELKRLYDKAHPNRDDETRQDDLLRRFFNKTS